MGLGLLVFAVVTSFGMSGKKKPRQAKPTLRIGKGPRR